MIERQEPAVVVTPTSSGKSFLSLKAVKTVLDRCKDTTSKSKLKSRVVIVSPTLPLANQMAATIYPNYQTDFGIFTRYSLLKIIVNTF